MPRPNFGYVGTASKSKCATIWVSREDGRLKLRVPYNPEFMEEFKGIVPRENREWDKYLKIWSIDVHFVDEVVGVCQKYFKLEVIKDTSRVSDCYSRFFEPLSVDIIKKIFRVITREMHPDVGGDGKKFADVMQAYKEILKEKGEK